MGAMASETISLTILYSTVYSGTDQRKHQSSASLAFVRGINRSPVNSPHKWPVTRKMFPFDDVIMHGCCCCGRPRSSHGNHIIQYCDSRNRSINLINNELLLEGQCLIWLQLSVVKPTKQQNGLVPICISQSMSVIAYKAYVEHGERAWYFCIIPVVITCWAKWSAGNIFVTFKALKTQETQSQFLWLLRVNTFHRVGKRTKSYYNLQLFWLEVIFHLYIYIYPYASRISVW